MPGGQGGPERRFNQPNPVVTGRLERTFESIQVRARARRLAQSSPLSAAPAAPAPFTGGGGSITLPDIGSPFVMSPTGALGDDEPLGQGLPWRWKPPRREDQ